MSRSYSWTRPFVKLLEHYESLNAKHPWKVNSVMAFSIASLGDILCQKAIHDWKLADNRAVVSAGDDQNNRINDQVFASEDTFTWDAKRTFDMGVIRSALIAPFIMVWFKFLRTIAPGGPILNLFCRIVVDQGIGSPIVIALVFLGNQLMQWPSTPFSWESIQTLAQRGPQTWLKGLQYNPIMNSINFAFVHPRHQPLYSHCAAIYWTAVLSYYSNKGVR